MAWGNRASAEVDFKRLCEAISSNQTSSNSITILRSKYGGIWEKSCCANELALALRTNTSLREVNCLGLAFPVDACDRLADMLMVNTTLRKIRLGNEDFKDDNLIALLKHRSLGPLQDLELERRNIGPNVCNLLSNAIGFAQSNIQSLDLSFNLFGDEGAIYLAQGFRTSPSLVQLELKGTNLGYIGAEVISAALVYRGKPLERLDVSFNPNIGPLGLHFLASVDARILIADECNGEDAGAVSLLLGKPRTMLSLSNNGLTNKSAALIAELAWTANERGVLASTSLRISKNTGIGDEGLVRISSILAKRRRLFPLAEQVQTLDVSLVGATRIPHELLSGSISTLVFLGNGPLDHRHLIEGLRKPSSLRMLGLSGTGITDISSVFQSLHDHPSLRTVEFGGIPLDQSAREELQRLKEANPELDIAVDKGVEDDANHDSMLN